MKKSSFGSLFFISALCAGLFMSSCKSKTKVDTGGTTTNVDSNNAITTTTPEIASDATLEKGVKDATKDYPGITATVMDGYVTLAGTVERDDWKKIKQSIDGLSPKKVNADQLIIK